MSNHHVRDMIFNLFKKAQDKLSDDELKNISMLAGDEAKGSVSNLKTTVEGIASLIANDSIHPPADASGAFVDDKNIHRLLYSIASQLEFVLTLQELECEADMNLFIRSSKS